MISATKRISLCAMCIALCYVLPVAFHSIGLGSILSPMHIPVLLCGLICGGWSGFLCGLIGPAISSLLSGMPPLVALFRMVPELCAYGLICGLMMNIRTGKTITDVYLSLVAGMIAGRLVGGIASAVFFTITTGVYSVALWFSGYFAESIPGIIAHLVLIPIIYITMEKARVIPCRYSR